MSLPTSDAFYLITTHMFAFVPVVLEIACNISLKVYTDYVTFCTLWWHISHSIMVLLSSNSFKKKKDNSFCKLLRMKVIKNVLWNDNISIDHTHLSAKQILNSLIFCTNQYNYNHSNNGGIPFPDLAILNGDRTLCKRISNYFAYFRPQQTPLSRWAFSCILNTSFKILAQLSAQIQCHNSHDLKLKRPFVTPDCFYKQPLNRSRWFLTCITPRHTQMNVAIY